MKTDLGKSVFLFLNQCEKHEIMKVIMAVMIQYYAVV